jgi:hypothetical protein
LGKLRVKVNWETDVKEKGRGEEKEGENNKDCAS